MNKSVRVAPSILAADFANLGDSVGRLGDTVGMLHVDVMDGHFVPNISLGPPIIASLRSVTDLYLDCHLMITDPLTYLEPLKAAGADGVTVHIEAVPNPLPVMKEAELLGLDIGLVVNPPTPVAAIEPFLDRSHLAVVMTVHPGFGGQAFMSAAVPKIASLRKTIDSASLSTDIEVDGGIDPITATAAIQAGADILVAGTAVFHAAEPHEAVKAIQKAATGEVT
jgi:ribulose-phosphate 3-epimerase